jgi:glycosyltransferase involved in cell wall biosynthesis
VLSQTEQDLEVIIVDDGSSDDTQAVFEDIKDSRVKYFYKPNGGAPSARNLGLVKAHGEYVAFLDSDDYWPKDYLEFMIKRLEENPDFGAAYSAITLVYPDGTEIKSYKRPAGKSGWITLDLFRSGFVWPTASIFRRNVWLNNFFDEFLRKSYDDGDAFLRLSVNSHRLKPVAFTATGFACPPYGGYFHPPVETGGIKIGIVNTPFLFVSDVEAFHTISGDSIAMQAGVACTQILVLERFYYKLGGDKLIPRAAAMRRLSHACRKVAKNRNQLKAKSAAIKLYLKVCILVCSERCL